MPKIKRAGGEMIGFLTAGYPRTTEDDLDNAAFDAALEDSADIALSAEDMKAVLLGDMHPITAWSRAAGMTQGQLAKAAGLRQATLSNIIRGRIDPRLSTLRAIAGTLGVDLDDVAG